MIIAAANPSLIFDVSATAWAKIAEVVATTCPSHYGHQRASITLF